VKKNIFINIWPDSSFWSVSEVYNVRSATRLPGEGSWTRLGHS